MKKRATGTVGLDLGDRYSVLCRLDDDGDVVQERRVRTSKQAISRHFARRARQRVVVEVGTHSRWVSRALSELGHEVVVANPRRVRLIAASNCKDDRSDAEFLARLGRADPRLLAPITHRSEQTCHDLTVLRARAALVDARTLLVNSVRGLVKAAGYRMPACSTSSFATRAEAIPEPLRPALLPTMDAIAKLTAEIRTHDKRIAQLSEENYPETKGLQTVAGVGPLTAVAFVLTLEDPARFRSPRVVGAYLGLTARRRKSGNRDPQLRITKAGDTYLRRLLVSCAQYILGPFGPDTALRRWGERLAARGGKNAKKRAVVAVARKLAVILYRLWVTGETYDPFPAQSREAA